jgi:hypothetical protein
MEEIWINSSRLMQEWDIGAESLLEYMKKGLCAWHPAIRRYVFSKIRLFLSPANEFIVSTTEPPRGAEESEPTASEIEETVMELTRAFGTDPFKYREAATVCTREEGRECYGLAERIDELLDNYDENCEYKGVVDGEALSRGFLTENDIRGLLPSLVFDPKEVKWFERSEGLPAKSAYREGSKKSSLSEKDKVLLRFAKDKQKKNPNLSIPDIA